MLLRVKQFFGLTRNVLLLKKEELIIVLSRYRAYSSDKTYDKDETSLGYKSEILLRLENLKNLVQTLKSNSKKNKFYLESFVEQWRREVF